MTKYYYTDPLKAAYMAREFGVVFTTELGGAPVGNNAIAIIGFDYLTIMYDAMYITTMTQTDKMTVHSGSHHIFEPVAGDEATMYHPQKGMRKVVFDGAHWCLANIIPDTPIEEGFVLTDYDKRDNKQFFMPEVE
ncbi:MAG: hypothetical protein MI745_14200 [Pseudomonadales bacterium]|nr:hypothetical protein [Pseudomonadales bacterium]